MKKLLILASLAFGFASVSVPASARNYDCTKSGNANKSACKSPSAGATVASHTATKVTATKTTTRNYDCTKAGNRNKAACRVPSAQSAPPMTSVKTTKVTTPTYDCSKFYNKMRSVCRPSGTSANTSTVSSSAPMSRPAATQTRSTTVTRTSNNDSAGASAQCKDGSFSHAQHRTGACSRHGGVAKWF